MAWRVLHTRPDLAASDKAAKKQKLCSILEAARAVDLHVTDVRRCRLTLSNPR
jgi:hypothetical protein